MVSKDDQGLIGSIYFERGRLRLIHSAGPAVEEESDKMMSTARWNLLPEELNGAMLRFCGGSRDQSPKSIVACKRNGFANACLNKEFKAEERLPNNVRIIL